MFHPLFFRVLWQMIKCIRVRFPSTSGGIGNLLLPNTVNTQYRSAVSCALQSGHSQGNQYYKLARCFHKEFFRRKIFYNSWFF